MKNVHKVFFAAASTGVVASSIGTLLMNLSYTLYTGKGFNIYSLTGGFLAIVGFALFLVAGYVVISMTDSVAGFLGVPSIGWLGKIVAYNTLRH